MRKIDEILIRAICLVGINDRVYLEFEKQADGVYSLSKRKEIIKSIRDWFVGKDYWKSMTEKEKALFNLEIGKGKREEMESVSWQIEAVEPCLWSINLVGKLSGYNDTVKTDFRPIIKMSKNHSRDALIAQSKLRDSDEIMFYREMAMLWHWRFREAWHNKKEQPPYFRGFNAHDSIIRIFGNDYERYFSKIPLTESKDFMIRSRPINELSPEELSRLMECSRWRHHAFEWLTGEDNWDNTDTST